MNWRKAIWRDRSGDYPSEQIEVIAYRSTSGNVLLQTQMNGEPTHSYISLEPVWAKALAEDMLKACGTVD